MEIILTIRDCVETTVNRVDLLIFRSKTIQLLLSEILQISDYLYGLSVCLCVTSDEKHSVKSFPSAEMAD